jgi:hypothetical protein
MRLDREPGEGIVVYFGEKPGQRYIGVGLGFSGYEWTKGGRWCWRFTHPYILFGRLYSGRKGRMYSRRVRIPARLWDWIRERRERKSGLWRGV